MNWSSRCFVITRVFEFHWLVYETIFGTDKQTPEPRFKIKMPSSRYRKSHCGDKIVLSSQWDFLYRQMASLFWIGSLESVSLSVCPTRASCAPTQYSCLLEIKFPPVSQLYCTHRVAVGAKWDRMIPRHAILLTHWVRKTHIYVTKLDHH